MVTITLEVSSATFDEENGVISGWSDVRLTQLGIDQSKQLGQRYAGQQLDIIFNSDLRRAEQTTTIAFDLNVKKKYIDWRLRDCDFGDLTNAAQADFDAVKSQYLAQSFPNGESYYQCIERAKSFLLDLKSHFDGKSVLVIAHPTTQYAFEYLLNGKAIEQSLSEKWAWQPGWKYQIQ